MRRRAALGGLLAALALLAACSPELDWRELRSDEGRFVAALPGKPRLDERELAGGRGAVMRLWSARAAGAVYGVGYVDRAKADAALVERTRDALAANIAGRVVEEREISHGPARGREFQAESADAVLIARVFVAGERLYQVAVVGKKGEVAAADLETFFLSFRLLPGAAPK